MLSNIYNESLPYELKKILDIDFYKKIKLIINKLGVRKNREGELEHSIPQNLAFSVSRGSFSV